MKNNMFQWALLSGIAGTIATAAVTDESTEGCFRSSLPYACFPSGDIDPTTPRSYQDLYMAYADMAWQNFVALNWPAEIEDGQPIPVPSSQFNLAHNRGAYTTVWEAFIEARDMFPPDGSTPKVFDAPHEIPDVCTGVDGSGRLLLDRIAKSATPGPLNNDSVLDEYIQANRMGPVIDIYGNYLRFGINFNEVIYDYIFENTLYNAPGQEAFDSNNPNRDKSPVDWPRGSYSTTPGPGAVGSIMVKSSWIILGEQHNPEDYHTVEAFIYNAGGGPMGHEPPVEETCRVETVGLLGFHIVQRSNSSPQWIWSTFEHVGNAPWIHDFQFGTPTKSYSLFDSSTCPAKMGLPSCEYNKLPLHPWSPERSYAESSQVVRIAPPGELAQTANKKWQEQVLQGFGDSAWKNYFMVDVQFPTNVVVTNMATGHADVNPAYPDGLPTPTFLANSTMETYIQGYPDVAAVVETSNGNQISIWDKMQNIEVSSGSGPVDPFQPSVFVRSGGAQRNTSSCISCHGDASLVTGTSSGFVFSLNRAQNPDE